MDHDWSFCLKQGDPNRADWIGPPFSITRLMLGRLKEGTRCAEELAGGSAHRVSLHDYYVVCCSFYITIGCICKDCVNASRQSMAATAQVFSVCYQQDSLRQQSRQCCALTIIVNCRATTPLVRPFGQFSVRTDSRL